MRGYTIDDEPVDVLPKPPPSPSPLAHFRVPPDGGPAEMLNEPTSGSDNTGARSLERPDDTRELPKQGGDDV